MPPQSTQSVLEAAGETMPRCRRVALVPSVTSDELQLRARAPCAAVV